MKGILILLILFAFVLPARAAAVYKWVDKDGVANFTDDREKIPPAYLNRVTKEDIPEAEPALAQRTASLNKGETTADLYGRGETWWKEKVRPLKERLNEATTNYENARKNFMEKAEELSERKFGSPTQYKMNIIELDRSKDEMVKYQAQIAEANEMLEKLSREAKETKANPDWLK